jgi:[glutamine synthetase] adenylyltransferase / [glutamine synthetase]-adenylyl-L-tyrosine phosphorylase
VLPPGLASRLDHFLSHSADPAGARALIRRFQDGNPTAFLQLATSPSLLHSLVTLLAHSPFLASILEAHPDWLSQLHTNGTQFRGQTRRDFSKRLGEASTAEELALFRQKELVRIVLRDAEGRSTLGETTSEISSLADVILEAALRMVSREMSERYGEPMNASGSPCGFCVLALGKLGAQELNYSSDIDLLFLFEDQGNTVGVERISNREYFQKLAVRLTSVLGGAYRVDLRLRPDGRHGEVALSLAATLEYYEQRARDWELQMLIKARPAAGAMQLGYTLLQAVEPRIYASTTDFGALEAVSETRERWNEKLSARRLGPKAIDVKLAPGGIRDIEFLVQCLQRLYGGREAWLRHGDTLVALSRLHQKQFLSDVEYAQLASAYQFFRHLEHRLQYRDDRQTHLLPEDEAEVELLARRMPASELGVAPNGRRLREEVDRHLSEVRWNYARIIHAQQNAELRVTNDPPRALAQYLEQAAPQLRQLLLDPRWSDATAMAERLLERLRDHPHRLEALEQSPQQAGWLLELLQNSPVLSEELLRDPSLLDELALLNRPWSEEWIEEAMLLEESAQLRHFFRRRRFQILCDGLCRDQPVFVSLARLSELAMAAIRAALRIALRIDEAATPPGDLLIIALGRLGMNEFDIGSDADLVFVLTDGAEPHLEAWSRVVQRMLDILSAYTGDGSVFSVDTRLRPDGQDGNLLQTEHAFLNYFDQRAEAWEGLAWMKARIVAGPEENGTRFLNQVQQINWRRHGDSFRSRSELLRMRLRIEKQHGDAEPLKSGRGGWYDLDFALLYLRLKGGGLFFRVLNTPERIDIIQKMGMLTHGDALLLQEAAVFYRALDHAMRLYGPETRFPLPERAMRAIDRMLARWTPRQLRDEPLMDEFRRIQLGTRDFFRKLFEEEN